MVRPAPELEATLAALASRHGLSLLVLFGSRARGTGGPESDWDLGYLAGEGCDALALLADAVTALATERIDVVDLARANGLLRYRAAAEGVTLHDVDGAWERFWLEAVDFWCDAGPILRAGYESILEDLRS